MVYVLNREGTSLMPTTRYGRVRRLLRKGHAVVVDYRPFTIQLTYDTPNGVQEVSLGVELVRICTNIPELYVVFGTLNSEPSILNRPLGNQ